MSTFLELGLKEPINKALTDLGYEKPTVIQEKAIPQIISSTDDLKAFAQTGTGKTAAFSLPVFGRRSRDGDWVISNLASSEAGPGARRPQSDSTFDPKCAGIPGDGADDRFELLPRLGRSAGG